MCEINPKRKQFFDLEFFTSDIISDEEWNKIVVNILFQLENKINESGKIRVHIHEKE